MTTAPAAPAAPAPAAAPAAPAAPVLDIMRNIKCQVSLPEDLILEERGLCDLELMNTGALAPLEGFMGLEDYQSCLKDMRLSTGQVWTVPIVLPVPISACKVLSTGTIGGDSGNDKAVATPPVGDTDRRLKLRDKTNKLIAEVEVSSVFVPDLKNEKIVMFGEDNATHPYVRYMDQALKDCFYVGGKVHVVNPIVHFDFAHLRTTPAESRAHIQERGYNKVVGFQTRNPMHNSHFHLTKYAMAQVEKEDNSGSPSNVHLMLTPAVGPTQPGDVDYRVRVRCYEQILHHYVDDSYTAAPPAGTKQKQLPSLVLIPLAMRMAGPREAVWHAQIRRNYGCTHFIVGRDHAGPSVKRTNGSTYYGPYDAHELIAKFANEIGISPVVAENMVYCTGPKAPPTATAGIGTPADSTPSRETNDHSDVDSGSGSTVSTGDDVDGDSTAAGQYLPQNSVPADAKTHNISGTEFRDMLVSGREVPNWFCFTDVIDRLRLAYPPAYKRGLCVYFTGLPCAGKSTLANALEALLLERDVTRKVTVLDADIIRTHLSKGLGFSRNDRATNVRRIGYVASEIVKHGGICLVANIAPYEADRQFNRDLIKEAGGIYVEVYVSTPLAVCEQRDIKELYKKARAGIIPEFTGISDPYEIPNDPQLTVNSDQDLAGKVTSIYDHLESIGACPPS